MAVDDNERELLRKVYREIQKNIQTQSLTILRGQFEGGFDRYQRECGKLAAFEEVLNDLHGILTDAKETIQL